VTAEGARLTDTFGPPALEGRIGPGAYSRVESPFPPVNTSVVPSGDSALPSAQL
jgi:hypothetical protein